MLDLLSPRFIQLGDFPHQLCNAGTIFLTDDLSRKNARPAYWYRKYPLLFRELKWWEHRKIEELPEYIKCISTPDNIHFPKEIYKIQWTDSGIGQSDIGTIVLNTDCYLPATKKEYETYMGIS